MQLSTLQFLLSFVVMQCYISFTTNNNNVQVSAVADEPVRCAANELQTKVDAQCDKRLTKLS